MDINPRIESFAVHYCDKPELAPMQRFGTPG